MPFPVQITRFAQALRRFFGIQGHIGLQLIDDVFPVVDLNSAAPEDEYLREERRFAQGITAAAVVGQFSFAALGIHFQTLGIAVIERLVVRNVGAGALTFTVCLEPADDPAIVPNGIPADSRLGLIRVGTFAYITQGAAAAFPSVTQRLLSIDVPAGASADLLDDRSGLVLSPGARYSVFCGTVNTVFFLSGLWREWSPSPQELRGG